MRAALPRVLNEKDITLQHDGKSILDRRCMLRVRAPGYAETGDCDLFIAGVDTQELLEERWFIEVECLGAEPMEKSACRDAVYHSGLDPLAEREQFCGGPTGPGGRDTSLFVVSGRRRSINGDPSATPGQPFVDDL